MATSFHSCDQGAGWKKIYFSLMLRDYLNELLNIIRGSSTISNFKRLSLRQFKQVPHVLFVLFNICAEINYIILRIWIGRDALRQMAGAERLDRTRN